MTFTGAVTRLCYTVTEALEESPRHRQSPCHRRGIWLEEPGSLTRHRWPVGAGAPEQSPVGHHDDEG